MKKILLITLIILFSLSAQALFEVKDASDQTVLEVSADGLRIFNEGDTLMVISSTEIKAFIDESAKDKALSRSFSVTTSAASGKGQGDVVNIAPDGLRVFSANENLMDITTGNITAYIDTSYSFNVTSSDGGKLETDVLEVSAGATKMREGVLGERYTDFSPQNIFLGLNAGRITAPDPDSVSSLGKKNIFIGNSTGIENTSGWSNIFVGYKAGYKNTTGRSNVFIGYLAGFTSIDKDYNTYVGYNAGLLSTGEENSFFGNQSGLMNIGNSNSFFGVGSGLMNDAGSGSCLFGYKAGQNSSGNNNIMMGYRTGYNNSSGSGNVFLGHQAGYSELGSNKLYIENSTSSTPLIYGEFDNDSLQINGNLNVTGKMNIPSVYTTTSANSMKSVYVDSLGTLCVASKGVENLSDNDDIESMKEDNEKLKTKIKYLESEIEKIKNLLNK